MLYTRYKVADISKLSASLKNEQSTNDRHNETENKDRKSEHSDSRPKSQRFCIFIFSQRTFLKNNLASRTNGTFGFCRHTKPMLQKNQKSHFFANARKKQIKRKHLNKKILSIFAEHLK